MKIIVIQMIHNMTMDIKKTLTKNKSIKKMMNAKNIIMWLIKQTN